jgi:RNA polymerase sigma-70 factor (ECF subfamily)
MVNDYEDARDVTQTTFVKAYEKLATYDPQYRFYSWIYRITINESLNLIRRRQKAIGLESELASPGRTPEEAYGDAKRQELIDAALLALPPDHRIVIILRHFINLSYHDIGGVLEIPEKTVKSRLYTARRRLCEVLAGRGLART